jgi:hypothetical protein
MRIDVSKLGTIKTGYEIDERTLLADYPDEVRAVRREIAAGLTRALRWCEKWPDWLNAQLWVNDMVCVPLTWHHWSCDLANGDGHAFVAVCATDWWTAVRADEDEGLDMHKRDALIRILEAVRG